MFRPMNQITATAILEWTRQRIRELADDGRYGKLTGVFDEVATRSDVSRSSVKRIYYGEDASTKASTIDELQRAVAEMSVGIPGLDNPFEQPRLEPNDHDRTIIYETSFTVG